jgi:transcriptional regulator with XRE-family HTH domain
MRNKGDVLDFRAFGQAIKAARLERGMTREQLAAIIDIAPRYLTNIENKGQTPSLKNLYKLVTLFNISVDQFFFPDVEPDKSTRRRQLDMFLNAFSDTDLIIMEATAAGINRVKEETKS